MKSICFHNVLFLFFACQKQLFLYFFQRFLENILRIFIVTPDFHRSHHSIRKNQLNKNFGFNLSLWDRVFKTYQKVSYEDQERIVLGLVKKRDIKDQRIWSLLKGPFY